MYIGRVIRGSLVLVVQCRRLFYLQCLEVYRLLCIVRFYQAGVFEHVMRRLLGPTIVWREIYIMLPGWMEPEGLILSGTSAAAPVFTFFYVYTVWHWFR